VTKPLNLDDKSLSLRRASGPKTKRPKGKHHTPETKIEVVTKWLALGNMRLVSDLTGVSYELIRLWKTQPWWEDVVAEVKASRNAQLDTKLSKIVDKALETMADRLENGNVKYDFKTKEVVRVPVELKEATSAAKSLMEQQLQMEKLKVVEKTTSVSVSVQDQIKMLASEFAKFNTKRTVDVVAKELTSAIHEEREEGLQEGSSPLHLETGSGEEEDGAECSTSDDGESWLSPQG
jgi:hypothetical protein